MEVYGNLAEVSAHVHALAQLRKTIFQEQQRSGNNVGGSERRS